eukprot:gene17330-19063_t
MDHSIHPVWEQKLATLFHRFDKGGKGFVTKEDIKTQIEIFLTQGFLAEAGGQELTEAFEKVWSTFLNGHQQVSKEAWIAGHRCLVESNTGTNIWEEALKRAGVLMFRAADKEGKGVITQDGFAVYLKCLGVDDECRAKEIFARLNANKDEMSEEDYLIAFHDFNYNKDDSQYKELMGPLA